MIAKIIKKAVLGAVFVFATTVFAAPSSREVREYECDYPDENEQSFLQDADQWIGTAWLKCIEWNEDWQGTNLDHYGNEHSTLHQPSRWFRYSQY